ncbi:MULTISPECIES: hypothetical protein [Salinicola]|uniref:Uncharacterized protein n=1 Tax=Salinicola endophyticus TaxID=1949083 RepID=A0AB74UJ43_9GAMM|nr:hypothetical protein [Salinicola sp. JS01]WIX34453.1 hypothetical protein QO259_07330 [Salinicola sp. JS01]
MSTADIAWIISTLAMTIAFATFFVFSATRRRGLLVATLVLAGVAVCAGLTAGLGLL